MYRTPLLCLALALAATSLSSAHAPMGTPKTHCEAFLEWSVHDVLPPIERAGGPSADGNLGDCDGDGVPKDFDGHADHAVSAALILVDSGAGVPSPHPSTGAGTWFCYGAEGHHPAYGPFWSFYNVALLDVGVDSVDITGLGQGCGDLQMDHVETFVSGSCPCAVTYPPGLDGSYHVILADPHPGTHLFW